AGSIFALCLVLAVIAFVLLVRAIVYIVQTFHRYGKESKGLWKSLWVFCGSCLLSVVLGVIFQRQECAAISFVGFFQLLMVSKVVQTHYSQTAMRESYNVVSDILRKDWWSSDKTARAA